MPQTVFLQLLMLLILIFSETVQWEEKETVLKSRKFFCLFWRHMFSNRYQETAKISQSLYFWKCIILHSCDLSIYRNFYKLKHLRIDYSIYKWKYSFISFEVVSSSHFPTLETLDYKVSVCLAICEQIIVLYWQIVVFKV